MGQHVDIPEGISTIEWYSDMSVNGSGWEFQISQTGLTADFDVDSTAASGDQLVVVAAYEKSERPGGVSTTIPDCEEELPSGTSLRSAVAMWNPVHDSEVVQVPPSQSLDLRFEAPVSNGDGKSSNAE